MTSGKRRLLGLVLLATLIAAWFAPPVAEHDDLGLSARVQSKTAQTNRSVQPQIPQVSSSFQGVSHEEFSVLKIRARGPEDERDEEDGLFTSTRWTRPVQEAEIPLAQQIVEAPPPQAPPLPFHFLGRHEEAGQTTIFLQHNEQNLVVQVGDTLAGQYKVESLKGTTLSLIYLPLNQLQNLEVGGAE